MISLTRCLTERVYPDAFKVVEVIPTFTKEDHEKNTKYHPILILSQFNKIFEKLLYNRIYSYLTRFSLLSDRQFGFRKNFSTTSAINKIYDNLLSNIDQSLYSCCIFLDLSKAFDAVNYKSFLLKLEKLVGFRCIALKLMKNDLIQ